MSELKPCPICGHAVESFEGNASCTNDPDCPLGCAVYPLDEWNATTERIRRLIAENRRAQPDTREWQPIETAPKDGTPIDLWVVASYGNKQFGKVGEFQTRFSNVRWVNNQWAREVPAVAGGWWELGENQEPTHWLPLPEPPAALRAQQEGK